MSRLMNSIHISTIFYNKHPPKYRYDPIEFEGCFDYIFLTNILLYIVLAKIFE